MSTRYYNRGRIRKTVPTTLGRAPNTNHSELFDLSKVRKPIITNLFGLDQVLNLFETATDEVRKYLAYECDMIYECRTCKSLFRSLANFILHKRNYCRELQQPINKTNKVNQEESNLEISCDEKLVELIKDVEAGDNEKKSEEDEKMPETEEKKAKKNLTTVLKRLEEKQENLKVSKEIAEKEMAPMKTEGDISLPSKIPKTNLCLEGVDSTVRGVFQTLQGESLGEELMKTEVMEIHSILNNNEAILGPDGKIKHAPVGSKLICTICNMTFSTKKTLTYHINYKHNETRLVYPCVECNETFANAWCVFRHLYKKHRKTRAQVRKLRDHVHLNPIVKSQDTMRKKESAMNNNYLDSNSQRLNHFESENNQQTCECCGKHFERKAALNSHLQICVKRQAQCNTTKENKGNPSEVKSPKEDQPTGARKRKSIAGVRKIVTPQGGDVVSSNVEKIEAIDCEKVEDMDINKGMIEEIILGTPKDVPIEPVAIHDDKNENTFSKEGKENKSYPEGGIQNQNEVVLSADVSISEEIGVRVEDNLKESMESSETVQEVNQLTIDSIEPTKLEDLTEVEVNEEVREEKAVCDVSEKNNIEDIIVIPISIRDSPESVNNEEVLYDDNFVIDITDDEVPKPETSTKTFTETNSEFPRIANNLHIKSTKKRKRQEDTLKIKSESYMNYNSLQCNHCNLEFLTPQYLMKHMALHFNWLCYQCSKCHYLTYEKITCTRHVQTEHHIDVKLLDNFIITLPDWKTLQMSTEFTSIDLENYASHKTNGVKAKDDEATETNNLNKQDPLVRKMIMEVIFGPESTSNGDNAHPLPAVSTRPARNRTSVKTLQTDFFYDMKEVDSKMKSQGSENKVKPIKIVKNNECDFKVINLSPSEANHKKKKYC